MTQVPDITRDLFLALAQELSSAVAGMVEDATRLIKETSFLVDIRDRVLIGLALKIESSFRSVMDDARSGRGEAMHHLKTMVESFLYLHIVLGDRSDTTAKQLITEVCYQKQKFLADNPEYAQSQATPDFWPAMLLEFESQGIQRIGKTRLKDLVRHNADLGKMV